HQDRTPLASLGDRGFGGTAAGLSLDARPGETHLTGQGQRRTVGPRRAAQGNRPVRQGCAGCPLTRIGLPQFAPPSTRMVRGRPTIPAKPPSPFENLPRIASGV